LSARVLVVDDLEPNRRLLEAKLGAEYYEVVTARRGEEAVQKARRGRIDIVLLDVMMPGGMDGFETCRRLKSEPETRHIPVVLVTTLDDRESRIKGLEAGAEDFLTKPIDDVQLIARVKNLVGLKVAIDELRAREASGVKLGVLGEELRPDPLDAHRLVSGGVLVVDDNANQIARVRAALGKEHRVSVLGSPDQDAAAPDMLIVSVTAKGFDGFRVIARMRSADATRHLPILAVVDPDDRVRAVRALELGASDIILRPLDEDELSVRARALMRRKRYVEALRKRLDQSLEMAVTDQLTGLYNRRFLDAQLAPLMQRAACGGEPVSVMVVDIDHFKRVNDSFGHDAGDDVLKEFSARMASNTRPSDFACRMGGEEFVVIMPNTPGDVACLAAERLRRHIVSTPFRVAAAGGALDVTASIGVAQSEGQEDSAEALIKRADAALYDAKRAGRNRVMGKAASVVAA
jgi:two-component system, cell cycle response regulator